MRPCPPRRIALLNPNTNGATTKLMAGIAQKQAPPGITFIGFSMLLGPMVVTNETALEQSALQIITMGQTLAADGFDGILISGFGDPGLTRLRRIIDIPVTGIAEAGMAAASANGRCFSIVTTTPDLKNSIQKLANSYGYASQLVSIRLTPGTAEQTMANPSLLASALLATAQRCAREDGADSILIGGGPLATAAKMIESEVALPIIDPVTEGAKFAITRLGKAKK